MNVIYAVDRAISTMKPIWRSVKMPATTEGLDRINEVIEKHIENRKLYDPYGARELAADWINLKAELIRAIVERDSDRRY